MRFRAIGAAVCMITAMHKVSRRYLDCYPAVAVVIALVLIVIALPRIIFSGDFAKRDTLQKIEAFKRTFKDAPLEATGTRAERWQREFQRARIPYRVEWNELETSDIRPSDLGLARFWSPICEYDWTGTFLGNPVVESFVDSEGVFVVSPHIGSSTRRRISARFDLRDISRGLPEDRRKSSRIEVRRDLAYVLTYRSSTEREGWEKDGFFYMHSPEADVAVIERNIALVRCLHRSSWGLDMEFYFRRD